MYIVIVGAGDIGTPLIEVATKSGNEVVVIERNQARAERAANYDCLVINDDATVKDTLIDAGADRADALISTTDRDAVNIMVCLLSQELDIPNVVSVVHDPDHMGLFERIGINTMQNPQRLIAEYLYRAVERPSIVDYMQVGEQAEVFEIDVATGAPVVGKTIRDADEAGLFNDDLFIVAIERVDTDTPVVPRGNTTLQAGDRLTVYAANGATEGVTAAFDPGDE